MINMEHLRELFIKYLTEDSKTQDMRRKDFNQAIFDKEDGWACYTGTDLSMVLDKFDMAIKEMKGEKNGCTSSKSSNRMVL